MVVREVNDPLHGGKDAALDASDQSDLTCADTKGRKTAQAEEPIG